jgi:hypothetical protein
MYRSTSLIEAYDSPENYWLVCFGLLAVHQFNERESSVRFLSSGFIHQLIPFGPLFTLLYFLSNSVSNSPSIRIENSFSAMDHCGEPNFLQIPGI